MTRNLLNLILFTFLIITSETFSNWESSFLGLLEKFDEEKLLNQPIISLWYGFGSNDNSLLFSQEKFANSYNLGIEYGFVRIKEDKSTLPYYLHFGERAYFENQSSHLKPKSWISNGKTIDGWIFGLKAIDGLGLKSKNLAIEFQHSASLIWSRFDFEDYFRNIETNKQIQMFDQQYKFGRNYGYALSFQFFDKLNLGLNYSQNYLYPEFEFSKWAIAYLSEILLQKWMEPFDEELRQTIGSNYWLYKNIYKSSISLLITKIMNKKPYLFFNTDRAFSNQFVMIKISYVGF